MKKILSKLRRCVQDFNMIQDGDKIAVGLSGGKDSVLLLHALKRFQSFSPEKFDLCAITIDMGFDGYDPSPLINLCKEIDVEYKIIKTNIGELLFEIKKEKNPCSLCANMRRGSLNNSAKEMGCNKIALGHHMNDALETFIISLFYEGRINTFSPVIHLDRKDLYVIRPFLYLTEDQIIAAGMKLNIPIIKNPCPANGYTKREYAKNLIKNLEKDVPDIKSYLLSAITNVEEINLWDKSIISKVCEKKDK